MVFALAWLVILAACGEPPVVPEPPLDADASGYWLPFAGEPGETVYVIARDGLGEWQPVALDAEAHGALRITQGFHAWAVGCPTSVGRFDALRFVYGAGPPPTVDVRCEHAEGTIVITGSVDSPDARVQAGGRLTVATEGAYALATLPTAQVVTAYDAAATRAQIVRDLDLHAPRVLDLAVGSELGFDLGIAPLVITGAAGDALETGSIFTTFDGGASPFPGTAGAVPYVPGAHRVAGDRMVAWVRATSGNRTRLRQHRIADGELVPIELPAVPPLQVDRAGARWGGEWDHAILNLADSRSGGAITLTVLRPWIVRSGAALVPWPDPRALPGRDRDGPFAPGAVLTWSLELVHGDPADERVTIADRGAITW